MFIKIAVSGQKLTCLTPYHPAFPSPARDMGGKWSPPVWIFDARDERRIRDLCLDLFGTDGTPCELVTLRVTAAKGVWDRVGKDTELYMAGRLVAKVFGCDDQRARLGDGVVITSGRIKGSGSMRSPNCGWTTGTVFELRDLPKEKAEQVRSAHPELIEILDSPVSPAAADVQVSPETQALIDERAKLLARLAEIDAALGTAAPAKRETPVFEVADELRDHD